MNLKRREVLNIGASLGALTFFPYYNVVARAESHQKLVAKKGSIQLAPPEYQKTEIWGYNGVAPGPLIRVKQGDQLSRVFVNELPQESSVHWHGIHIENSMDGVSGLTQQAVTPGNSFTYEFNVPDAGTYWYHAHHNSIEQVGRGLYGTLIVDENEQIDIDREEILVIDDWRIDPETGQIYSNFNNAHDRSHAGRIGNLITTNSNFGYKLPVKQNERIRFRLLNVANARIFSLGLSGLNGWIVAFDGMPVLKPIQFPKSISLAPGQRIDLVADVVAESGEVADIVSIEEDQGFSIVSLNVEGRDSVKARTAPNPLPPNPSAKLTKLEDYREIEFRMEGGAMAKLGSVILDGQEKTPREIAQQNKFWAFNGIVGMTDAPLATVSIGETVLMTLKNETSFSHVIHLHGMHFRIVTQDLTLGEFRDSILLSAGESKQIAFLASNPGNWLLHCHMLAHSVSGMKTWINVV